MTTFDLVIRNGRIATAADVFRSDIGIAGAGSSARLRPAGGRRDDRRGRALVLPGGIDSHCHMDQQPWEGKETADDFLSGTISAACGGNTTSSPSPCRCGHQSLRAIVDDYHERAARRPSSTMPFT